MIILILFTYYLILRQYGFRHGYSCSTQLKGMDNFTSFMDSADDFDCIYIDFAKALDNVPHSKLLLKVINGEINGNILTWIANFF